MHYTRSIPDAPVAPSMLPRVSAESLTLRDILVLTQPGNNPGEKNKGLELGALFEAMRSTLPTDTLLVNEQDENPSHYLINKFNAASAATYLSEGDVNFIAVSIRGAQFIVGVIENQAVTTEKIADDAVTNEKIASGAVSNGSLADNSVSTDKIIDSAVTPEKIDSTGDYSVKSLTATNSVNAGSLNVTNDAIIGGNAGVNGDLTVSASKKLTAAGEAVLGDTTARKLTLGAGTDALNSVFKADSTFDMTQRFTDGVEGEIKIVCNTNNQYPIDVTCTTGTISIPVHGAHMFVGMGSSSWFSIN